METVESNVINKNDNAALEDDINKNEKEGFGGFDEKSLTNDCQPDEDLNTANEEPDEDLNTVSKEPDDENTVDKERDDENTVNKARDDGNTVNKAPDDANETNESLENEKCELEEDKSTEEKNDKENLHESKNKVSNDRKILSTFESEKYEDDVKVEADSENIPKENVETDDEEFSVGFCGFDDQELGQDVISTMNLEKEYSRMLSAAFNESGIKESDDDSNASLTPIKDIQSKISPKRKPNASKKITFKFNYTNDSQKIDKRKRKRTPPSSNILFKEPFKYGWKRELVIRQSLKPKACGDVYYFSPVGKKFRSLRELNETLPPDGPLKAANFSFTPEALYLNNESDKEIVRPAKVFTRKDKKPKNYFDFLKLSVNKGNDTTSESPNSSLEKSDENISQGMKRKASPEENMPFVKKMLKFGTQADSNNRGEDTSFNNKRTEETQDDDLMNTDDGDTDLIRKNIMEKPNSSSTNGKGEGVGFRKPKSSMPKIVFRRIGGPRAGLSKYSRKSVSNKEDKQTISPVKGKQSTEEKDEEFVSGMLPPDYKNVENNSETPSTSVISSERQKTLEVCSISCEKAPGIVPTLQCKICLCLFHPQCCGLEAQKPISEYVCLNCNDSSTTNVISSDDTALPTSTTPTKSSPPKVKSTDELLKEGNKNLNDGVETSPFGKSVITVTASPGDKTPPFMQSLIEISGRKYIVVPRQSIIPADVTPFAIQKMDSPLGSKSPPPIPITDADNVQSVITPATTQGGVYYLPVVRSYPMNSKPSGDKTPVNEDKLEETDKGSDVGEEKGVKEKKDDAQNKSNGEDDEDETPKSNVSISTVATLHTPLVQVFQYLKVHEMLKIARTCKYFNCIIHDDYLWRSVKMRNSLVHDWKQFANTLIRHRTKTLDLKKMLVSNKADELEKMWQGFMQEIPKATSLENIDICKCPSYVVEKFAEKSKNIQSFTALSIKSDSLDCTNLCNLPNLRLLRLRGFTPLAVNGSLKQFASSSTITTLTLLNVNNLKEEFMETVSNMINLEILELGECTFIAATELNERWFSKLTNLRKLRLEKLPDLSPKYHLIKSIGKLNKLTRLELINIDVKYGFDRALATCTNLKQFLIIPTYSSQSATTNQLVINGTNCLSKSLEVFVWGLTIELLKITDLFMDKWRDQKSSNNHQTKSNSIPILKSANLSNTTAECGSIAAGQVDIIQIPKLEKMLTAMLPKTKIKVLKIPYSSTWRQTI